MNPPPFADRGRYARLRSGDRVKVSRLNGEVWVHLINAPISLEHASMIRMRADEVEDLIRRLRRAAGDAAALAEPAAPADAWLPFEIL
jgi:hypothetical protein